MSQNLDKGLHRHGVLPALHRATKLAALVVGVTKFWSDSQSVRWPISSGMQDGAFPRGRDRQFIAEVCTLRKSSWAPERQCPAAILANTNPRLEVLGVHVNGGRAFG
jgi:hypothetical protein